MRRREFLGRSVGVLAVGGLVAVPAIAARTNQRFMSELIEPSWIVGKRAAAGVRDPWEPAPYLSVVVGALARTGPLSHRDEVFWAGPAGSLRWHAHKDGRADFPDSFAVPVPDGIAVPALRRRETMADVLDRFRRTRTDDPRRRDAFDRVAELLAATGPVEFLGVTYSSWRTGGGAWQMKRTPGGAGLPLASLVPVPAEFLAPGAPGSYAVVRANSRAPAHFSG